MIDINLSTLPNQSVSFIADQREYEITVKDAGDCMAVTIAREGVTLVSGHRALPGAPLLPSRYQEGDGGNLAFLTDADALPDWREFGLTQTLVYLTAAEVAAIRAE